MNTFDIEEVIDILLEHLVDVRVTTREYELSDNQERANDYRGLQVHLASVIQYLREKLEDERSG
jgi:hypothetical protein